jgi:hypothetical protein
MVVVGAPEKRDIVEAIARAKHIARNDLALTLGNYPVLDA